EDSNLLDLGCGSGIIGKEFGRFFNSEILGLDILDNRVIEIPFRKYDGKDLSFLKDDSFDAVLINFVLHHCQNPLELLKESKRVTKDIIVIYENIPEGLISKIFCYLHGVSFACFFQKNENKGKFLKRKEWETEFEKMGLKVLYSKKVSGLKLMKEHLYILKKGV
ncbi:class I SAM-dependent methyltransferase, partial [bacterium]|nr:class I SAM-dependent methyltransferase [bacterium]